MTEGPRGGAREAPLELLALSIADEPLAIRPAPVDRAWFAGEAAHFVKRCLPLLIANQSGWELLNPCAFTATWDGGTGLDAVCVQSHRLDPQVPFSHFGLGVLTWKLPYLFRTPPGWNLLARGPANAPRDGIAPLEGVVETDWTSATFTMNWKFTRPHHAITFEEGEPFCMIVPVRRGELERFRPRVVGADELPRDHGKFTRWAEDRRAFLRDLAVPGSSARKAGWQGDYMLGRGVGGEAFGEHQSRLSLAPFEARGEPAPDR